jgi:MFS family permease
MRHTLDKLADLKTLAADVFPRRMRGLTAGCLYAAVSLGGFLADIAGGAYIQYHGPSAWRFNIYISGA